MTGFTLTRLRQGKSRRKTKGPKSRFSCMETIIKSSFR
jgi:hypothetical protein